MLLASSDYNVISLYDSIAGGAQTEMTAQGIAGQVRTFAVKIPLSSSNLLSSFMFASRMLSRYFLALSILPVHNIAINSSLILHFSYFVPFTAMDRYSLHFFSRCNQSKILACCLKPKKVSMYS